MAQSLLPWNQWGNVLVSKSRKELVLSQISFEVFPLTLHQLNQPPCSSFGILVSLAGQALLLGSDGVFVHSARRACIITALVLSGGSRFACWETGMACVKLKLFSPALFFRMQLEMFM